MSGPRLIPLGFDKWVRADRVYALVPVEDRGPGRRTLVWVEGIAEPLVASRSAAAIRRDVGPDRLAAADEVTSDALALLGDLVERVGGVGALVRREIRTETSLDLDALERRARDILERTAAEDEPPTLFGS